MTLNNYLRIVRASAWYDLLVTWPFMLPWTFVALHGALIGIGQHLHTAGNVDALNPTMILLANLLGSVVVVWAIARILKPTCLLGQLDAIARMLFATWQIYAVQSGASQLVLAFTVFEVMFALLQLMPTRKFEQDGKRPC
jgi:uncharacterized membrane protein